MNIPAPVPDRKNTISSVSRPDITNHDIRRQASLAQAVSLEGVGLHSGIVVKLTLKPAPAHTGIVFIRTDITDRDRRIFARPDAVSDITRCTTLSNAAGVSIATVEHLMAALAASGVDNVIIEMDGDEVPAMDGSSELFLNSIERAGVVSQDVPRRYIKVLKPVEVQIGEASARLDPATRLSLDVSIDFAEAAIGQQRIVIEPDVRSFRDHLSRARTFARAQEVSALQAAGLSRGGSYDNAIVVDEDKVLNPGGLRYADEFVRHKALDLLGDLYVAGPLLARVTTHRAGHAVNHKLLLALFADADAWCFSHVGREFKRPTINRVRSLGGKRPAKTSVYPLEEALIAL